MNKFRLQDHFRASPRFSNKLPAIYLDSLHDKEYPHHIEVYLVNNTSDTLDFVASTQPLLFIATLADANIQNDILYFEKILPGEAVKVAEFDEVFDSDFLHKLELFWQHKKGPVKHAKIISKGIGKIRYKVLEWLEDAE
ncbi:MAG: hypothetical protein KC643_12340 [Nitrospira sp.]|nr:hypothetical protein [Nitrospira sp.]